MGNCRFKPELNVLTETELFKILQQGARDKVIAENEKNEEQKKQLALKKMHQQLKYKQELHDQMIYNERSKRAQYEEFLQEKKMLDDIIQRLHDEDER